MCSALFQNTKATYETSDPSRCKKSVKHFIVIWFLKNWLQVWYASNSIPVEGCIRSRICLSFSFWNVQVQKKIYLDR